MRKSINYYVAMATITFKAPHGWRPSKVTCRKCFVCTKRNDAAVDEKATRTAEEWKQKILEQSPGLKELTYSIKIETSGVCDFDILDNKGKSLTT